MLEQSKKRLTVVHFGTDHMAVLSRTLSLRRMGYIVLVARSGVVAIQLAGLHHVGAVVLDLHGKHHEDIAVVAAEIKRCRPQVSTILLCEGISLRRTHRPADVLVPQRKQFEMLAEALDRVLVDDTQKGEILCGTNEDSRSR